MILVPGGGTYPVIQALACPHTCCVAPILFPVKGKIFTLILPHPGVLFYNCRYFNFYTFLV